MNDFRSQNQRFSQPQSWSPSGELSGSQVRSAAEVSVSERLGFIRKVYALFSVGILFGIGGVLLGFTFPQLMLAVAQHHWIAFFAMIGSVMGAQAVRHVRGVNLLALFGFTTLTGVVIWPLFYI